MRHLNRIWTSEDFEKMVRHLEPALKAWQAAWARNPHHSLERPNPFGLGPLSADSIPLLDMAYVRLFVDLSRSKEKFWLRDFDGMAQELSRGNEVVQHENYSPPSSGTDSDPSDNMSASSSVFVDSPPTSTSSPQFIPSGGLAAGSNVSKTPQRISASIRERYLRKAAFYAVNSLAMSDKLGTATTTFTSRELPLQSALCAFDCAQVLAEWITTVQERVGRYLGMLGRDQVDLSQVPSIMLLEEDDITLVNKLQQVLDTAEAKMNYEMASQMNGQPRFQSSEYVGFGSRMLRVAAYILDKAAAWPSMSRTKRQIRAPD